MTGEEYKVRREALSLTQAALAQLLDVHRVTVAKREAGEFKISREIEMALERVEQELKRKR